MDAAFEVAIAGQHRRDAQLVVTNGLADRLVERARIADAGRAAVGDDVVAKVFEIFDQAGLLQVFGDGFRSRRQRGLHPRLRLQAECTRFAREQAGTDQRSEEHTSELQSLMRISYAVFCLKKKKNNNTACNMSPKLPQ